MAERRYCQNCEQETLHDVFTDGLVPGEPAPLFEKVFFGVCMLGMNLAFADKWRVCQVCGRKTKSA